MDTHTGRGTNVYANSCEASDEVQSTEFGQSRRRPNLKTYIVVVPLTSFNNFVPTGILTVFYQHYREMHFTTFSSITCCTMIQFM